MGMGSRAFSTYMTYKFVKSLTTAWTDMPAYKLGIIDDKGVLLKKFRDLETPEEKNAYTMMDRLVWNIKRFMEKVPGGKSKIARYGAAMWMLREHEDEVEQIIQGVLEEEACINNMGTGQVPDKDRLLLKKKKKKKKDSVMTRTEEHIISEGKQLKTVVRGGKRKKVVTCTSDNQKVKGGKCVTKTGADKKALKKAAKKRGRTMKGKSKSQAIKKMLKSRRKAH